MRVSERGAPRLDLIPLVVLRTHKVLAVMISLLFHHHLVLAASCSFVSSTFTFTFQAKQTLYPLCSFTTFTFFLTIHSSTIQVTSDEIEQASSSESNLALLPFVLDIDHKRRRKLKADRPVPRQVCQNLIPEVFVWHPH